MSDDRYDPDAIPVEPLQEVNATPPPVSPGWNPPPPPATPTKPRKRTPRPLLVPAAVACTLLIGVAVGVAVARLTQGGQAGPVSGASPVPAPTNPTAAAARALYQQALVTTRGSSGFHYVAVSAGPAAQNIVGDAGRDGGRQVITFDSTHGTEHFTLVLVGGSVYFQGDTPALEDQLGVPAAKAPSLQNKWVSVSRGDGPYSILQPGITVADQAQEVALVPASTARVATTGGVAATRILGTVPPQQGAPAAAAHLDIAPASHLPIAYAATVTVDGVAATSTTTFSGWGTAPSVSAPSGAIAWSTVGASPPPGGYGGGGGNAAPSPTPQAQS